MSVVCRLEVGVGAGVGCDAGRADGTYNGTPESRNVGLADSRGLGAVVGAANGRDDGTSEGKGFGASVDPPDDAMVGNGIGIWLRMRAGSSIGESAQVADHGPATAQCLVKPLDRQRGCAVRARCS